jgi:hypothetical protein
MVKFFLLLLRPIERFLAQWISVSTEPSAFVRERIRLGDTTNFLRAVGFFLSTISTAFLAEVATLHLLGIGNMAEPYYWLFILLTSIPFVLFCFLLIRFVAPLSFRDVLHLSLYPVGAGILTGAVFALVASTVVALLVAVGGIPEIKYDFSQWEAAQEGELYKRVVRDCLQGESLTYTIVATGLQIAYEDLKSPIDELSYLRPVITVLYLAIAARFFMATVDRRKSVVFGLVLMAALLATGVNIASLKAYLDWNSANSSCEERGYELGLERVAESLLQNMARDLEALQKDKKRIWDLSAKAEGRVFIMKYRFKRPVADLGEFYRGVARYQMHSLKGYCSGDGWLLRDAKASLTHIFYSPEGERLTSFSIGPADCPQW